MGKKPIDITTDIDFQRSSEEAHKKSIKIINEEYTKSDNSFICVLSKDVHPHTIVKNNEALAGTPALFCIYPTIGNDFYIQCITTHDALDNVLENDGQGMRLQLPKNMKNNDGFVYRHDNGFAGIFKTQEQAINYAKKITEQAFEKAQTAENPFKVYSDIYIGKEPADQDVMLTETQAAVTAFVEDYIGNKGYSITTEELYNMLSSEIDPLLAYSMTQELATSDIIIDDGFFEEEFDEEIDEEEL